MGDTLPEYPADPEGDDRDLDDGQRSDRRDWDRLIQQSPDIARRAALARLDEPDLGSADRAVAEHALGRALLELGSVGKAVEAMRRAVDASVACRPATANAIAMTAAIVFAEAGALDDATSTLDALATVCSGPTLGRVRLQQGLVLHHAGRLTESLAALDESDRLFALDGAGEERFRVHVNRGVVLLQQGELDAAEADFLGAAELARGLGMTAAEGQCHANLGAVYGRGRRLVEALAAFDRAESLLAAVGRPARVTTWLEIDRAEVLMHSGMSADAVEAARRAFEVARTSGNDLLTGDALLMVARTELAAGLLDAARRTVATAREHFAGGGRHDMSAHVAGVAARVELLGADHGAHPAFGTVDGLVAELRDNGWHQEADDLTVERLRAAWRIGDLAVVADDVERLRLHAFGGRRDLTLMGWFAEAVARVLGGDLTGSVDACRAGLDILDGIVAEAPDLEARSAAMRLGTDLSRWLIEAAVDLGDARLVLAAGEGTRARALHDELAGRERHRPLTEDGARRLLAELTDRLQGRWLVQWVVARGRVHAVVCDGTGRRLVDVADLRAVLHQRDRVMMWLDLAASEPDDPSARARRAAGLLDQVLVEPLDLPEEADVVIVPVDELHGVPWSGLPTLATRTVTLSPSARLWLDADGRSQPVASAGFVAGPNLAAHDDERAALSRCYGSLTEVSGAGATAATVSSMFAHHDVVHVAAHGRFRADRPLLSTFELADGTVTLHETIPDQVATRLAVLSSCEGGAHQGSGGSEVLGLASVLLARGAISVLAPLTIVRDLECGEFVAAVHDEMATGLPFGRAVADVRTRWLDDDDLSRWAVASSFCCFGSGATRRRRE